MLPIITILGSLNMDFVVQVDELPGTRRNQAWKGLPNDPRRQGCESSLCCGTNRREDR